MAETRLPPPFFDDIIRDSDSDSDAPSPARAPERPPSSRAPKTSGRGRSLSRKKRQPADVAVDALSALGDLVSSQRVPNIVCGQKSEGDAADSLEKIEALIETLSASKRSLTEVGDAVSPIPNYTGAGEMAIAEMARRLARMYTGIIGALEETRDAFISGTDLSGGDTISGTIALNAIATAWESARMRNAIEMTNGAHLPRNIAADHVEPFVSGSKCRVSVKCTDVHSASLPPLYPTDDETVIQIPPPVKGPGGACSIAQGWTREIDSETDGIVFRKITCEGKPVFAYSVSSKYGAVVMSHSFAAVAPMTEAFATSVKEGGASVSQTRETADTRQMFRVFCLRPDAIPEAVSDVQAAFSAVETAPGAWGSVSGVFASLARACVGFADAYIDPATRLARVPSVVVRARHPEPFEKRVQHITQTLIKVSAPSASEYIFHVGLFPSRSSLFAAWIAGLWNAVGVFSPRLSFPAPGESADGIELSTGRSEPFEPHRDAVSLDRVLVTSFAVRSIAEIRAARGDKDAMYEVSATTLRGILKFAEQETNFGTELRALFFTGKDSAKLEFKSEDAIAVKTEDDAKTKEVFMRPMTDEAYAPKFGYIARVHERYPSHFDFSTAVEWGVYGMKALLVVLKSGVFTFSTTPAFADFCRFVRSALYAEDGFCDRETPDAESRVWRLLMHGVQREAARVSGLATLGRFSDANDSVKENATREVSTAASYASITLEDVIMGEPGFDLYASNFAIRAARAFSRLAYGFEENATEQKIPVASVGFAPWEILSDNVEIYPAARQKQKNE